ncbi:major facilitator superfamily transporter [Cucurbitaria berberidis CBS 394.84]|uniref:Major facilitator superfamily transporter n=1 Tax=Cucurbitaria berberidis CBS 394.84 TaxID=1168544 RepID=A0A9P4GHD1_9PLEO|nr:major facilitator superfamily transporter [Cucurbitaria berberidis CBS 394.84]KAF1846168.1 major facilitator superfamily transporter [Cucurbitaria berberidis CBS 394.84]
MEEQAPSPPIDPTQSPQYKAMSKRVNRKMDIALLPFLSLLYLFNGLDRSNVGNAETQGFTRDIGASPDDLNLAVSLFFITFVLLQPPSAAVGRWVGAKHWITIIMLGWGVFTVAHAFIRGRNALIAMRLMIGAFEAGFYPTAVAYLSFFYCRYDMAVRVGLFYGQYAIAGAFSGSIAYGVFHLKGTRLHNWQYLFIIEGTLTILIAVVAWFWLPRSPGSAWFLNAEEQKFAAERILKDNAQYVAHEYGSDGGERQRLTRRDIVETGKDWKLWYVLVFNICASVPSQAFSVFLPLVVQGLGYSSIRANLMSVPPYVCGATGLYLFALSSDYHKERGYHIVGGIFIALVGLIITVTVHSSGAKYAGLCILLLGSYISPPLTVVWLSGNTPEPGKRSLVLGVNGFGNLAGVIGSQLYKRRYAPHYLFPSYVTIGFITVALVGYTAYKFSLQAVNSRKAEIMASKTAEEIEEERVDEARYADKKWTFIYGL